MLPEHSINDGLAVIDKSPAALRPQVRVLSATGHRHSHREGGHRTIGDYLRILHKYRWSISAVGLSIVCLTTLYAFLATPQYTASSMLNVGTYVPVLPGRGAEDELRQQTHEQDYFKTQIGLLTSLTLADRVLSEENVADDIKNYFEKSSGISSRISAAVKGLISNLAGAGSAKSEPPAQDESYRHPVDLLRSYLALVSYSDVHNTSLVKVAVTTADPVFSARLANAHSRAFIELVRSELRKGTVEDLVFLQSQADELEQKIAVAEQDLADYAEKNAIVPSENIVAVKLEEINRLLTAATAKRINSESAIAALLNPGNMPKANAGADDDATTAARNALQEAEAEYAKLSERFRPSYPKVAELRARIDSLETSIERHKQQSIRTLELELEQNRNAERELQSQLEQQKTKSFELSRRQVKYNTMQREFESLKDLHQAVLHQLKEAEVRAASTRSNVTISEAAPIPLERSKPKRLMDILLSCFFGPLLGFLLALVRENFDNTVQTVDDIREVLGLPVLGIVPLFKPAAEPDYLLQTELVPGSAISDSDRSGNDDGPASQAPAILANNTRKRFVLLNNPQSVSAEAFRLIRTNLLLSSVDHPPRVILFTSAFKGEGKTTIASNLAIAMAQTSGRTILIEADLRQPTFRTLFSPEVADTKTQCGLSDFLAGHVGLQDILLTMPIENLSLIPSGSSAPNPSELLGSPKFKDLIKELLTQFDYVLIDAPPVIAVADSLVLSRVADGTVIVVRSNHTHKGVVHDVAARFAQINSRILGVVLNQAKLDDRGYFPTYYNYDTYISQPRFQGEDEQRQAGNL